jgi:hypothetical protein
MSRSSDLAEAFYERDTPSPVNERYPPGSGGATQFKIPSSDNLVLVIYS